MEPDSITGRHRWASQAIANERAAAMTDALIRETNMRCTPDDTLIMVGDFCCYGNEKGTGGVKVKAKDWEDRLNPKVIHVMGNHDNNNTVKSGIRGMVCKVAHWTCWVQHVPPWNIKAIPAPAGCDAYICGHVHTEWKLNIFENKPVVNVGVDVNNYRPVKQTELIELIRQAQKLKEGNYEDNH